MILDCLNRTRQKIKDNLNDGKLYLACRSRRTEEISTGLHKTSFVYRTGFVDVLVTLIVVVVVVADLVIMFVLLKEAISPTPWYVHAVLKCR